MRGCILSEMFMQENKVFIYKKRHYPYINIKNTYARLMPACSVTHHVCYIYNIAKKESQDVNFIENLHPDCCYFFLFTTRLFAGYNTFLSGPATVIGLSFDFHIRPDLNIIFFLRFQILNLFRSVFITADITCLCL